MDLHDPDDQTPTPPPEDDDPAPQPARARSFTSLEEAREAVETLLGSLEPRAATPSP